MSFKAGDKVKCIDAHLAEKYFTVGESYIIDEVPYEDHVCFRNAGDIAWQSDRFELIGKEEDMKESNEVTNAVSDSKFKVGDLVKITKKDGTLGWYDGMQNLLGTEQVIDECYFDNTEGISYKVRGWYFPPASLELVQQPKQFNPAPGDKIICNNGEEFTCCTLEYLQSSISKHISCCDPILGCNDDGWNGWLTDGTCDECYPEWSIREVIPAQKEETVAEEEDFPESLICTTESYYTAEDIRKAVVDDLGWQDLSLDLIMKSLQKVTSKEYNEYLLAKGKYLRLKDMFENEQ